MAENDFDLSGLSELQTETPVASQPAEAPASPEVPTAETPVADAPKSTWTVGNTEYDSPDKMREDYEQMLKAFTKSQQQLKAMGPTTAPAATDTPVQPQEQGDLTPEQIKELQRLVKTAGFVSREELEAERQKQQQEQAMAQFEADKASFLKAHDGSDGLPKAEEAKVLTYMQENGIYNFDAAYKSMYMDEILTARAKELFEKQVKPANPVSGTSAAVAPPTGTRPNFDDPKSIMQAIEELQG